MIAFEDAEERAFWQRVYLAASRREALPFTDVALPSGCVTRPMQPSELADVALLERRARSLALAARKG